jgi:hypothetical protein
MTRRWRDKGAGKHDGAAAVYVPPQLVFKALQPDPAPPPPSPSSPSDGGGSPAAAAAAAAAALLASVRVVSLAVDAPEGFFPANPIQVCPSKGL